ncbi:SDR family oxidoreductase [Amycolatopsis rhizosphaerae]|uniref:SDR family oxidoreductase n=1 Tax=Amycolatopsis rhizosphaerae TaxID=2053003 RepID=A0A558CPK4_9PSEU|nr:SDR family oxidoreductase [Amycolatopsis rhizosphaerae]TVT50701.1 SDR family oxidoreductase [Amycolatopsis rhizosphaerae]
MSPRTALITGGTSGIGRASAEALHRRGYQVIVTGQNPDTLAVARRELPEDIVVVRADSRSLADTDRVVEETRDRFGGLDVLFLNAGIVRALPVEAVDEATFDDLFDVNFKGQFFTLQKALPLLREGGSVLFTIGLGAIRGVPGGSVAAASKGALLSMVPTLALELAPRKIRVNAVSPGAVRTGIWDKHGLPPEALEAIADGIPLGRFGTSEEIAETVAFLASDAAAFITGENIVIGGGSGLRS